MSERDFQTLRLKVVKLEEMITTIHDKFGLVLDKFLNQRTKQVVSQKRALQEEEDAWLTLLCQLKTCVVTGIEINSDRDNAGSGSGSEVIRGKSTSTVLESSVNKQSTKARNSLSSTAPKHSNSNSTKSLHKRGLRRPQRQTRDSYTSRTQSYHENEDSIDSCSDNGIHFDGNLLEFDEGLEGLEMSSVGTPRETRQRQLLFDQEDQQPEANVIFVKSEPDGEIIEYGQGQDTSEGRQDQIGMYSTAEAPGACSFSSICGPDGENQEDNGEEDECSRGSAVSDNRTKASKGPKPSTSASATSTGTKPKPTSNRNTRTRAKHYTKVCAFDNEEDALAFIKSDKAWVISSKKRTRDGMKAYYRCKASKECPVITYYLVPPASSSRSRQKVIVYRSDDQHIHVSKVRKYGIPEETKQIIDNLFFHDGIKTPLPVSRELQRLNVKEPTRIQLINYLTKLRQKMYGTLSFMRAPGEPKRRRKYKKTGNPRGRPSKSRWQEFRKWEDGEKMESLDLGCSPEAESQSKVDRIQQPMTADHE